MPVNAISDAKVEILRKWLPDRQIVIADLSSVSRTYVARMLIQLGANVANVLTTPNFDEAERAIEERKAHIVICDYKLGNKCGLDLIQRQKKADPKSKERIFILLTGDSSQTAVARAAEEDCDSYILKPFTSDVLRLAIMKAILMKVSPPAYWKKIESGREAIAQGNLDEAERIFRDAVKDDPRPATALSYLGHIDTLRKSFGDAEGKFQRGLYFNKIHYKCMVGLFDTMMEQKRHADAYGVVKRISQYFPANPQRLTQVLKLAIMTKSYDDVEAYYHAFKSIDERNDEMVRYVCAALVVCGKYYLQRGIKSRAVDLFQGAATSGGNTPRILREIIQTLHEFNLGKSASEFLKKFPPEHQSERDYLACALMVADTTLTAEAVIVQGRRLVTQGVEDPMVYKILIRRSAEEGLTRAAEDLAHHAIKKWPDEKEYFQKLAQAIKGAAAKAAPEET